MENENKKASQSSEEIGSKDLLKEVVKSSRQEAVETLKYPGIKLVSRFAKIIGIILFVTYFFLAIVALFVTGGGFLGTMLYFLQYVSIAFIWLVLGFLIGDLLQVLVDIEENTRGKK